MYQRMTHEGPASMKDFIAESDASAGGRRPLPYRATPGVPGSTIRLTRVTLGNGPKKAVVRTAPAVHPQVHRLVPMSASGSARVDDRVVPPHAVPQRPEDGACLRRRRMRRRRSGPIGRFAHWCETCECRYSEARWRS